MTQPKKNKTPSALKSIVEALGRGPVHPFPARMAPGIALDALASAERPLRVLDPMMGSGTVLAVARSRGHRAFGVDMDPLAVLLGKVWTTTISVQEVRVTANRVLKKAVHAAESSPSDFPLDADVETRRFLRYWFNANVRVEMVALSAVIRRLRSERVRNVLLCALSRLVISKQAGVSRAMDVSHSRPHRAFKIAPTTPFSSFLSAVEAVLKGCPKEGEEQLGPPTCIREGDARALPIEDRSIDLVLTSPPYLNAIDYIRCSKFSLVWMGHSVGELRTVRSESIGTEASTELAVKDSSVREVLEQLKIKSDLPQRQRRLLSQYIFDMRRGLDEIARVLAPGGRAVFVVGDSTVRGSFVRNSRVVKLTGIGAGLKLVSTTQRKLPPNRRYLPPPSTGGNALDSRMRREVILAFTTPS